MESLGQQAKFDDWYVERSNQAAEAYTTSGTDTSLGVYCANGNCMFYLRVPLNCITGAVSTALFNSGNISGPVSMQCMMIGQRPFQVLTPFNDVMNYISQGAPVGLAVPLHGGVFAVSRFETRGAKQAIDHALKESSLKTEQNLIEPQKAPSARTIQFL
jgi:hypothetical protein